LKEYSFNPLQAEKELQIGNFYFKTGKYRSAAMRFTEATKWNDGSSDAWLRLGETEEKLKDPKAAKEAYTGTWRSPRTRRMRPRFGRSCKG